MISFIYRKIIVVLVTAISITHSLRGGALSDPSVYERAYPGIVTKTNKDTITLKTGEVFIYDDLKPKSFDEVIESPDMEDQLSQKYPLGKDSFAPPAENFDPGRIRNEAFFKAVYGGSQQEVSKNLVPVVWLPQSSGQTVMVTKINGVNIQLEKVSQDLDALPANLKEFVMKLGGTFNWRPIAGTTRLSSHSYGIAIDINPDMSSYWRWDKQYLYKNRIPHEIIVIFEKHGFIWGGKWYHYDTMHFEYRPELLPALKMSQAAPEKTKSD